MASRNRQCEPLQLSSRNFERMSNNGNSGFPSNFPKTRFKNKVPFSLKITPMFSAKGSA